jgi:hypothetical protein
MRLRRLLTKGLRARCEVLHEPGDAKPSARRRRYPRGRSARYHRGSHADVQGSYIGVIGRAPTGGFPLIATDTSGNNLFYVDGSGNVSYRGGLFSFAKTAAGATVKSFNPKTTLPTIEDTGTAQLVGGVATVRGPRTGCSSRRTAIRMDSSSPRKRPTGSSCVNRRAAARR